MSGDETVNIGLRRVGANRVHRALVPERLRFVGTLMGFDVIGIQGPIVARCGAKLRGDLIEIPYEYLVMDSQQKHHCRVCDEILRYDYRPNKGATSATSHGPQAVALKEEPGGAALSGGETDE